MAVPASGPDTDLLALGLYTDLLASKSFCSGVDVKTKHGFVSSD